MKHATILAAAAAFGLGSHAPAQTIHGGFELRVSNVVSPSQPTATVEVWAWFDPVPGVSDLFAFTNFDLIASQPLFIGYRCPLSGCKWNQPRVNGGTITGVSVGQLHIPGLFPGDPSNPILIFTADWRTTDFTPRSVSLETADTVTFGVAAWLTGEIFQVWPNVTAGSGSITIVPAPSLLLLLPASAFAMALRRRRSIGTGIAYTGSRRALTAIEKRVILYGNRSH